MSTWLVTGAAGFIGSHLVEALLQRGERVVPLDLEPVNGQTGDVRNLDQCRQACDGVDFVLHQAAQCSVPASIADPLTTHETNVTGFLNILLAARDTGVKRVVYASSCAVYGDSKKLPNTEEHVGNLLSPYALSKFMDELYATMFDIETIGLRYFNVYGPRQDPNGPYAAVIPRWINALLRGEKTTIFGDGTTTRDFVFVEDIVNANLLAATAKLPEAVGQVYNVASGNSISLNFLYAQICKVLGVKGIPVYADFRPGDILHSSADISKIQRLLGFKPAVTLEDGLKRTVAAYRKQ
jgi:UDP-N-acetylglucosamine/UDP-N-acetyl-alpha-D-glucosaminouronate 4-epimerase